ncbi:MAG: sulfatase [Planctomycetota bacterium]
MRGILIAGAWLCLVAGCSHAGPAPGLLRPLPHPEAEAPAWTAAARVARFEPLAEGDRWTIDAPTRCATPRTAAERDHGTTGGVLTVGAERAEQAVTLRRRGPYDPSTFHQLRVVAGCLGGASMTATWRAHGQPVASATVAVEDSGERGPRPGDVRTYAFDVPPAARAETRLDELELRFDGELRALRLHALELWARPLEALLPDPHLGPVPFELCDVTLATVGVSTRVPVALDLGAVRGADARVVFSYGVPAAARPHQRGAALVVRLGDRAEPLAHYTLDRGDEAGWTSAILPVPEAATLRFAIEHAGGDQAVCALGDVALVHANDDRPAPTVLLVTTDTHRGDHVGSAAQSVGVVTPNLDALAARGVAFDQCFTWSNMTNPSHVALMTGHHVRDTGIVDNAHRLPAAAQTLAEVFRDQGYATWASVSAFHLRHVSGLEQGFDRISGPVAAQRRAAPTVDRIQRWLPARAGRPLFVWVHVFDAHWPYEPPPAFAPELAGEPEPLPHALRDRTAGRFPDVREARAKYRGEVTYLDGELGRLFDLVGSDEALIAVVGDHGESLGAHGYYFTHADLYPDTLHVPLIVAGPGVPPGRREADLVAQPDLGRTMLDLAGLTAAAFPGRHLLGPGAPAAAADDGHYAVLSYGEATSITKNGHHLILHLAAGRNEQRELYARERHAVELYDLRKDPGCTENLVDRDPERARAMRAELIRWMTSPRDLGWPEVGELDDASMEQLQALGYVGRPTREGLWEPDACAWCQRFR